MSCLFCCFQCISCCGCRDSVLGKYAYYPPKPSYDLKEHNLNGNSELKNSLWNSLYSSAKKSKTKEESKEIS